MKWLKRVVCVKDVNVACGTFECDKCADETDLLRDFPEFADVFVGCSKSGNDKLVIGTDATYPPFEFVNEKGELSGVSIDLGKALAQHLGREVEFRNTSFEGLVMALKTGSVDMVISSMTATDEKRKSIDFSDPYVRIGLALLVSQKSPVQSAEDLNVAGRRIAVRLGTTGAAYAKEYLSKATQVVLDSDAACVLEVVQGGVDAWIYDQLSLMNYHEKHPDTTRVLLKPVREEFWAIGLRQGDDVLKKSINEFLTTFRAEGGFQKLGEKYLVKQKKMMESQGLPFVFEF